MAKFRVIADVDDQLKPKVQIAETFRLVYFDTADDNECLPASIKCKLRNIVHQENTFETISECENLIKEKVGDKILVIVNYPSDHLTKELVRCVHDYRQVSAIYLIDHRQTAVDVSKYTKVIHVVIDQLITQFSTDQIYRQKYDMPAVSILDRSTNSTSENFGILYMMDEACRRVPCPTPDNLEKFLSACREYYSGNTARLRKLDQFEREYTAERALWWYTNEPFIYDIMNKALRMLNIPVLQLLTFFIRDIHGQLAQLHRNSAQKNTVNLYRGQAMNRDELSQLQMKIGEIVSMNSFLSTSTDRETALGFAIASTDNRPNSDELSAVLFEIEADPSLAVHTPFANICMYSAFPDEEEHLFHLNSLFHVCAVEIDQQITIIRLKLAILLPRRNDDFTNAARAFTLGNSGDIGRMTISLTDQMNSFMSSNRKIMARKILHDIRNSSQSDKHALFTARGDEAISYYEYTIAIEFYREALLIDPSNARSWTQLAKSYYQLDDYQQTVLLCHRAIDLSSANANFLTVYCHRLLGISLAELGQTTAALLEIEKAIEIFNSIETDESEVTSHKDKGSLRLLELCSAFYNYMKSRKEPKLLALVYDKMGTAYEALAELQEALKWFEKALDTYQTMQTDTVQIARLQERIHHVRCSLTTTTHLLP